MNNMILYILCGIPGCGKSTWALNFLPKLSAGSGYVSRDEIRFSMLKNDEDYFTHENDVFNKFISDIVEYLKNDKDVIADATHLNEKSRFKLIHAIDEYFTEYQIIFVYFNTPFNISYKRNRVRKGLKQVPFDTMYNMAHRFMEPRLTEDERCIGVWYMKGWDVNE